MHPVTTRALAVALRERGYLYPYISKQTGLSKSTLSGWLRDIPYTPNKETIAELGKARAAAAAKRALNRQQEYENILQQAAEEIGTFTRRDVFMFGLGLYLGEGAKTNDVVKVTNADPKVIRLAITWFLNLGVPRRNFHVTLHLYPDCDYEQSLQFWSRETTIPLSQFGKVQIDVRTNKRAYKKGKLPFGTAHLSVRSRGKKEFGVLLARRIRAWNECLANKTDTEAGLV